ncbi:putative peptidase C78, ubiquitin modifier-specific peptidase 1/ 2 [Lupinus albus]|uniref:Putative peptidase C78, ubiquitin modifier-specific peptidase 1/ 2 n=1 Tax=Lupinus albus TaxID=3870 RepID=A0A6A4P998_LUPAL|nr:putative peptidase C78, ubiquitin modifier-specific peptidase 1/ 2 [Lupinus albus]
MALLRSCLESEAENSRTILLGYVDHFQSIESDDVGWGCGWRNIQMLSSHLPAQRSEAREILFGEIAWERGFDVFGSDQFNHAIYDMKKWIGTTECAALFHSYGLRTRIVDFGPKEYGPFYLSVSGSIVGGQQLVGIDAGRKRKSLEVYGPMDRYLSREDSQASCCWNDKSCSSPTQLDSTVKKESGGDRVSIKSRPYVTCGTDMLCSSDEVSF